MLKPLEGLFGNTYNSKRHDFLDVFGGSGLVAHNLKMWYPNNRDIWNDQDSLCKSSEILNL